MTTIPSRGGLVGKTFQSLFEQSRPFDQLRVYTPPGVQLSSYWAEHVVVCPTEDYGSVTKISAVKDPAVPDDALVITVDDDILYHKAWLDTLLRATDKRPDEACGFSGLDVRGFLVDPKSGDFITVEQDKTCDVLEGFAGVAYHKAWFKDTDILNPPAVVRFSDDLWIGYTLNKLGIKRRVVAPLMVTASNNPGIHTRPDFRAKNIVAINALFGPTVIQTAKKPLLSICIPSLNERALSLELLLTDLKAQQRTKDVEILTMVDNGRMTTGSKRNILMAKAKGKFIVSIDDDDLVSQNYIPAILAAIESRPDVDAVCLRGHRTSHNNKDLFFDYHLIRRGLPIVGQTDAAGVLWYSPNHLCPIRADIAKRVPYPDVTWGEDMAWMVKIAPYLKVAVRAGAEDEVLYHYRWDPSKKQTVSAQAQAAAEANPPKPEPPPVPQRRLAVPLAGIVTCRQHRWFGDHCVRCGRPRAPGNA